MNVLFRVDGYQAIGRGHVTRSLALAEEFKRNRHRVIFLISEDNTSKKMVIEAGFQVVDISKESELSTTKNSIYEYDIDIYISDVDYLSNDFFVQIRNLDVFIVQLDIKRNLELDIDLLVNGGIYAQELLTDSKDNFDKFLMGPKYNLLRREFSASNYQVRERVKNVLVMFGATDVNGLTGKLITQLPTYFRNINFHFICNEINSSIKYQNNIHIYKFVTDIKSLYSKVDIAIIGGGVSAYEVAALGIPSIIITQAENQIRQSEVFDRLGISLYISDVENLNIDHLNSELEFLISQYDERKKMSVLGRKYIDGKGVSRVVDVITERYYNGK